MALDHRYKLWQTLTTLPNHLGPQPPPNHLQALAPWLSGKPLRPWSTKTRSDSGLFFLNVGGIPYNIHYIYV